MSEKNKVEKKTFEDRLPPQNTDAEQSVLGSLMLDKDALIKIADVLQPEDFYRSIHGQIYQTILELFEKNEPIDLLSVSNCLNKKDYLEKIGGSSYLTTLINAVPTAAHVSHYAKIVRDKKILRDLIASSLEISQLSYQEPEDIDQLVDTAEQKIFSVSQKSTIQKFTSMREGMKETVERVNQIRDNDMVRGVASGFEGLDNFLSGFQKSDMVILAARPSLGKTTLAIDFVRHAAVDNNIPVAFFSIEMAKEQILERLLASQAKINLWRLRNGSLSEENHALIPGAADRLSSAPIFINDTSSPTVMQLRTIARRIQAEHELGLIVIDYIQLIQPRNSLESTVQQYTEISRNIKTLARELCVPVVALSQLNRSVEHRMPSEPRLSDLRDSGSFEQDADVVLMLYRRNKSDEEEDTNAPSAGKVLTTVKIAKHRNGPTGEVELNFDKNSVSFETPPPEMYLNQ